MFVAASIAHHPVTALSSCLLAATMMTSAARPVAAQDTTSHGRTTASVAGEVRDSLGHPIMLATVSVDSETRRATSDDAGRFSIQGLSPGRVSFRVQRIGYEALGFVLDLPADSTLHIVIRMHASVLLQAVVVRGAALPSGLVRTGFYERQHDTNGQFLTPAQVDSSIELYPSELVRSFHGVDVVCGASSRRRTGGGCSVIPRHATCLWLFVDGHYIDAEVDDVTSRTEIGAVEFYEQPQDAPGNLQGPKKGPMNTTCAALVIWTKLKTG